MGGGTTITGLDRAALVLQRGDAVVRAWRVGAVLQALVTRTDGPARAWLRIAGTEVPVRTHGPFEPGTPLTLRVAAIEPRVVLEPMPRPQAPPDMPRPVAAAWRAALPRQIPLARALPPLLQAAPTAAAPRGDIPPSAQTALAAVAAGIPSVERLADVRGLREAFRASGLFLEASLAARGAPPPADLKLALARLAAALRALPDPAAAATATERGPVPAAARAPEDGERAQRVPPRPAPSAPQSRSQAGEPPGRAAPPPAGTMDDLADAAEAALARITARQLESLPRGEGEPPRWSLELPLRLGDGSRLGTLALRVEARPTDEEKRRGMHGTAVPRRWHAALTLDLGAAGAVRAGILLEGERVAVRLTADRTATAERLRAALDRLAAGLRGRGLEPRGLEAAPGPVSLPEPLPGNDPADGGPLLEEEA